MAEKKKKPVQIVAYTPEAITLSIGGEEVLVATTIQENAFLNMVLASQGRSLIQRALSHWKDEAVIPSPKELRDIAGAMKDIAAFSAEVYAAAEPVATKDPEKQAEKAAEEINFEDLTKPIEPNGEAPKANSSGPSAESPEGDSEES